MTKTETSGGEAVVLHQFPFSHYNEKARWALDFKGIPHQRKNYLPGPHAGPIEKLSGQSQTPVLSLGQRVVSGSAAILEALEEAHQERPLLPSEPDLRADAQELQARFDEELGPAVRTAVFSVMLDEPGYMCAMFSSPQPLPMRWIYRGVFPLAKGKVERAYRVREDDHVLACREVVDRNLEEIENRVQSTGYLVGDRFTVADLTAASLLAPVADPDHIDMKRPEPQPESVRAFVAPWRGHPACDWVREMYRRHR